VNVAIDVPVLDLPTLQAECNQRHLSSAQVYDASRMMGFDYGPGYRGVEEVYVGAGQVLAKLSLPPSVSDTQDQFVLHPCLLDSAFQALAGFTENSEPHKALLPVALQELEILGLCTSTMWALLQECDDHEAVKPAQKYDIDICDIQGKVCIRMKGLALEVSEGKSVTP
jgi:polyketide synthase PksN